MISYAERLETRKVYSKRSDEAHELGLIGLGLGLSRIIVMINDPIKFVFELLGVQKFPTFCEH